VLSKQIQRGIDFFAFAGLSGTRLDAMALVASAELTPPG
jgi:hypothetical protein